LYEDFNVTSSGCLCVVAYADAKDLQMTSHVESLREKVYVTLEEYCRRQYPDDPGRFAKLLLRLPALRSIGLKCPSYLFLSQLCQDEGSSPEMFLSVLLKGMYTSPPQSCWHYSAFVSRTSCSDV